MEFLVVSDSKLKIMMSREDMIKYEIDGDDIDYDDPKTRRAFWRILDAAKEACGFEASGDKVLIQFYPAKDGSEIFVTKLGLISPGAERTIAKSSKVAMLSTKMAIYQFLSFENLVYAVRMIEETECEKPPKAYFDDNGAYYLIVEERRGGSGKMLDISPITEFGKEIPSNLSSYISEHSRQIDFNVLRNM